MKKIRKILSAVITAAMAISTFVLPASANTIALSDEMVEIFSQDFDGYGNAQELTRDTILPAPEPIVHYGHKIWAGAYGHSNSNDKTLVLCKDLNGRGAAQILTDTVKTSGKYKLTYKLYPANGNNILVIDDKTDYATVDVRTNENCPNCLWVFNVNTLERQWYDVELTVDLDNNTETVNIYVEGSSTVFYTRTQNYYANLGIIEFAQSNNGVGEANSARIDDIKFYGYEVGTEPDYLFKQDFEGYATGSSSLTRDTIYDNPTPIVHFGHEVYAGTDYGHSNDAGNKVLLLSKDHANKGAAQILTDDVKTSGKYKLTYKLYPANGGNVLVIDDRTDFVSIATRTNSDCPNCLWVFNLNNSTLTRQWYDVELLVDLDNDTETVNIYEEGSSTVFYTRTQGYYANLGIIEFAQAASGPAGRDNSARIDDIEFYELYSDAPSFTSANVKCYADGDLQANLNKVNPFTDEIVINFPQKIKADTLTANNIYITDPSSNKVTVTSQVVDGKVCTLTPSASLTPGATYTLHIANLANTSGHTMSSEFTQSFTVAASGVITEIKNVTVDGSEVTAVNQLTGGSTMTINYSVANSTASAQNTAVIVAFYNYVNNIPVLVNSGIYTGQVAANTNANSLSQTHTVPTGTFNDVVVMIWDDMTSISPLTTALEFENYK